MTTQPAAPAPSAPSASTIPSWQGAVTAQITRLGVDTIEEIDYADGVFTRRFRVVGGESPAFVEVLDALARERLLTQLRGEPDDPPVGTDTVALRAFSDLLEDTISATPSHRFDSARFGAVSHDETRGIYFGHLGLVVDVAGTVQDDHAVLSFEQHVVTMVGGRYQPLSAADRRSLADALTAYLAANPDADPGWTPILTDAQREDAAPVGAS